MKVKNSRTLTFVPDSSKHFIGPKNCRPLKDRMLSRIERLTALEHNPFNLLELRGREVGIITSGGAYGEVIKQYPYASVLRLRLAYPLVEADVVGLLDHLTSRSVIVFEDGDPVVLRQVQELASRLEFRVEEGKTLREKPAQRNYSCRLCPACPHRGLLYALKSLGKTVMGDAGCSALASLHPLECVHAHTAMGASIATAAGMNKVSRGKVVALIGDAALLHSGINALVNVLRDETDLLVVILDNGAAALTGGQVLITKTEDEPADRVDWNELLTGLGLDSQRIIVTNEVYNYDLIRHHIDYLYNKKGLNVLVVQGMCSYALGDLDALITGESKNLSVRNWKKVCDDCAAVVRREDDTFLVASDLCGECTLCN